MSVASLIALGAGWLPRFPFLRVIGAWMTGASIAGGRNAEPFAIGLFMIANEVVAAVLYAKALLLRVRVEIAPQ